MKLNDNEGAMDVFMMIIFFFFDEVLWAKELSY